MNTNEKWNKIVELVKSKSSASENEVQQLWEKIFTDSNFFGYSLFLGEVDSKRNIHIGSVPRVIPDIIIRNNELGKDLFVIELKQHCLRFSDNYKNQLFSYMRLLRLNIGVLVCDKIYIFTTDGNESPFEIPFENDNEYGIKFVELFSKCNYSESAIKEFVEKSKVSKANVEALQAELQSLLLVDLIKKYYASKYSEKEVESALKDFEITIKKKQTPISTPPNDRTATEEHPISLDGFSRFLIDKGHKPTTANSYISYAKKTCQQEKISFMDLYENIGKYVTMYDVGGIKEDLGEEGHRTRINSLKRLHEFRYSIKKV